MASKAKDTESFSFSNWTVEVHRRPMRRSVSIYLYPQRPIKVVAGKMTSQKVIYEFLLAKRDWIEKHFNKFEELAEKFPKRKIQSYQKFPFFGQDLALRMTITVLAKAFVARQDDELRLHIPRNDWSAEVLTDEHPELLAVIRDFYKREAIKKITERTQHWAEQMHLFPKTLKFREQKTRWGSCSSRGAINFNWRLIVFKPEIIDYVIIHELAHLRHMNHSAAFWNLVEAHCPAYENFMKELRESQHLCEFLTPQ
ncbi:M48 family metallopeptidase [Bdellovibrio sp. HCB337]|uniref:M48 family metallopeptidase n=1 Tax=Bdellovibrio sp. HCB337 TaxID=3394358 RepID=UPI0039A75DC8